MKKKKLIITVSLIIALLTVGAVVVYAAAYNSESDPLVALSYLTNVFKPSIDSQITAVGNRITEAENKIAQLEGAVGSQGPSDFDTTEIDGRLDALEGTSGEHTEELSQIKAQLTEAKASIEEIKQSYQTLSDDAARKEDISSLNERLEALSLEVDLQTQRLQTLVDTYEALIELLVNERVPSENNYGYETVMIDAGERVVCTDKCSMMLRSGAGTYTFTEGGYDTTAMTDLTSPSSAVSEHIVIFENGAEFTAAESSAIMIKGEYTIEQQ